MASSSTEECSGAASKKRPRDSNESSNVVARPAKNVKSGCDEAGNEMPQASPPPATKVTPSITTPAGANGLPRSPDTGNGVKTGDSGFTLGTPPPSLILSSEKLKPPSQGSTPAPVLSNSSTVRANSSPFPSREASQCFPPECATNTVETMTTTRETTTRARGSSWSTCILALVILVLFWTTTITLGFWLAEKLDRELDAHDHHSSLTILENEIKTQQTEHHDDIEKWKTKVSLVERELKAFRQECSSMFERLEHNLQNSQQKES